MEKARSRSHVVPTGVGGAVHLFCGPSPFARLSLFCRDPSIWPSKTGWLFTFLSPDSFPLNLTFLSCEHTCKMAAPQGYPLLCLENPLLGMYTPCLLVEVGILSIADTPLDIQARGYELIWSLGFSIQFADKV